MPKDPQVKVQIYNAEIAPGGYTNWHCHNGATFFIALQGIFEAEFEEGILVKAKAGDVYSEPIARIHRGHNPHPGPAVPVHRVLYHRPRPRARHQRHQPAVVNCIRIAEPGYRFNSKICIDPTRSLNRPTRIRSGLSAMAVIRFVYSFRFEIVLVQDDVTDAELLETVDRRLVRETAHPL